MNFDEAVQILAGGQDDFDDTAANKIAGQIAIHYTVIHRSDEFTAQELTDWVIEGDFDGSETVDDLAREWLGLLDDAKTNNEAQG